MFRESRRTAIWRSAPSARRTRSEKRASPLQRRASMSGRSRAMQIRFTWRRAARLSSALRTSRFLFLSCALARRKLRKDQGCLAQKMKLPFLIISLHMLEMRATKSYNPKEFPPQPAGPPQSCPAHPPFCYELVVSYDAVVRRLITHNIRVCSLISISVFAVARTCYSSSYPNRCRTSVCSECFVFSFSRLAGIRIRIT